MRSQKKLLLTTLAALASATLAACASSSRGMEGAAPSTANTPVASESTGRTGSSSSSSTTISAEEIAKLDLPTTYDVVNRLHRRWFHDISTGATASVAVYINMQKSSGGAADLRQIPSHDVARIDYLKASEAVVRLGPDASGGAILVTRK